MRILVLVLTAFGATAASAAPVTLPRSDCPSNDSLKAYMKANHCPEYWGWSTCVGAINSVTCMGEISDVTMSKGRLDVVNRNLDWDNCNANCGTTAPPPGTIPVKASINLTFTESLTYENELSLTGSLEFAAGSLLASAKTTITGGWKGKRATTNGKSVTLLSEAGPYQLAGCTWARYNFAGATVTGKYGTVTARQYARVNWRCTKHNVTGNWDINGYQGPVRLKTDFVEGSDCLKSVGNGSCPPNNPTKPAFKTSAQMLTLCGFNPDP